METGHHGKIHNLAEIKKYIEELEVSFTKILQGIDLPDEEGDTWAQKVLQQLTEQKNSLNAIAPWLLFSSFPPKFGDLIPELPSIPTLRQVALIEQLLLQRLVSCYDPANSEEENEWLNSYRTAITEATRRAKEVILTIEQLSAKCMSLSDMEYDFLFDQSQNLLSIGYNAEEHRRDNSYYDLLASEARLTTFVGIAQGKLPQASWFALGRQLTNIGASPVLLSWSGSMFEYLMPLLVMPNYENT